MNLYLLIKKLQNTSSTNEKQAILMENKNNVELATYIKLSHCPSISFYIGEKTYPKYTPNGVNDELSLDNKVISNIIERKVTGHAAITLLSEYQNSLSPESAELLQYMVLGDTKTKIGAKSFNKVWDKLIVDIPYNRCSLPDDNTAERVNKSGGVYIQLKGDGVFGVLVNDNGTTSMYTRNGTRYPKHFTDIFKMEGTNGKVIEGEIIWYKNDVPIERKISNGITNSIANGGDMPTDSIPKFLVWNILDFSEWDSFKSNRPYEDRFNELVSVVSNNNNIHVQLIDTHEVTTMAQATNINTGYISQGLEGSIIKFKNGGWAYNTNKDMIKLKIEVDIDMRIESIDEATGKNVGMAGRINVVSEDGRVRCGVNCTGTEQERIEFLQNKEQYIGKVISVTCNDIISSEAKDTYALFLGRTDPKNIRFDKDVADDLNRINEIFHSIGVLKNLK